MLQDKISGRDVMSAAGVADQIGVLLGHVQDQLCHCSEDHGPRLITSQAVATQKAVADLFIQERPIPRAVDIRPLRDDRFNRIIEE